ncbi:hypothetical protein L0Y25_13110 [Pectobacterium aroidearum]|uniref:hypothetical protein n=1 Tax=Pectobacterium aroidearum TaxID=1201031 RepID=UPI002114BB6B|nr:hypothetical protein [Pectobacterium aroidearum]UUE39021.1 hypothetical protein L0Y25_13110 [Pectobacterium aroidearum]
MSNCSTEPLSVWRRPQLANGLSRNSPALQDIRKGLEELADEYAGPSGHVRINSHHSAATLYIAPKLRALLYSGNIQPSLWI